MTGTNKTFGAWAAMALTVALVVVLMALAAGAVLAADSTCTGGDCLGTREADNITGSTFSDRIAGLEGNDVIDGRGGDDVIYGDEGADTITISARTGLSGSTVYGDEGNDTIYVNNSQPGSDEVRCGPGKKDKVFYDKGHDIVARNCEIKKGQ